MTLAHVARSTCGYTAGECRYCADIAGLLPGYQNNVHEADICGRS